MRPSRPFRGRSLRPQVERVEPRRLLATITVTTSDDSGPGSLRDAITRANAAPDLDTIAFDIPGQGVRTIRLAADLPAVVAPVVIDGYTQRDPIAGDARPNSLPDADDARLLIALDGMNTAARGLDFEPDPGGGAGASGSTVRGLVIGGFTESGISIRFCDGVTAEGNFVGVDPPGTAAAEVGVGVTVAGSTNCVVGGTTPAARNLIGGYLFSGVTVTGDRTTDGALFVASGNVVAGNFIGVDATGEGGLGRQLFGTGVTVGDFATDNTVGGADPGARNVISDNPVNGVLILGGDATRNLVAGNFIGTNAGGTRAIGNSISGVKADGSGGNTVSGNLISGNLGDGVVLNGNPAGQGVTRSDNVVAGNRIGTNASGDAAVPNTGVGVLIFNSDGNTVGGSGAGAGNLISGNGTQGVLINTDAGASTGNVVLGNRIGTTADGMSALGNGDVGVFINRASGNTVGGAQPGAGNVISGNGLDGVVIGFETATGNAVLGNRIGTTADGARALPNAGSGVRVSTAPGNRVGGPEPGAGNLISGNRGNGLFIFGTAARNTVAQGNRIGTDASGTKAVANGGQGVEVTDATGSLIGGAGPGEGNVISGNGDNGVKIGGLSSGNVLQGNRVGTTADGAAALGNDGSGVLVDNTPGNFIGGTAPGAGNLISGNGGGGVVLFDRKASGNLVQGNRIGTDAAGLFALGNAGDGVFVVNAPGNTVGGPTAAAGNLISGNLLHGVEVFGRSSAGAVVANNRVGTDATGTSARGNRLDGILVTNAAGVSVLNNLVSGNGQAGVEVSGPDASGASVAGNRVGTNAAGTASSRERHRRAAERLAGGLEQPGLGQPQGRGCWSSGRPPRATACRGTSSRVDAAGGNRNPEPDGHHRAAKSGR
ncbi:MAG: right-handed parallel beta-helix repeat-containing protein [Isosphaeraceae bacterium]